MTKWRRNSCRPFALRQNTRSDGLGKLSGTMVTGSSVEKTNRRVYGIACLPIVGRDFFLPKPSFRKKPSRFAVLPQMVLPSFSNVKGLYLVFGLPLGRPFPSLFRRTGIAWLSRLVLSS
jgi:hypothetical protein